MKKLKSYSLILLCILFINCSNDDGSVSNPDSNDNGTNIVDGWSVFEATDSTKIIYVSASEGDDSNDGRSETTPVETIAKAKSLIEPNVPNWILLKRGDEWFETFGGWARYSGESSSNPFMLSYYGELELPRPIINSNESVIVTHLGITDGLNQLEHIAIVGIHFYAEVRDPSSPRYSTQEGSAAISWLVNVSDFLIEDNVFEYHIGGIALQQDLTVTDNTKMENLRIRRNLFLDSYSTNSHSSGIFIEGVTDLFIEENIFDKNGWNEELNDIPTKFNHNVYLNSDMYPQVVFKNNISTRASSHGVQLRSGGTLENNLFVENSIAGFVAGNMCSEIGSIKLVMTKNVALHGSNKVFEDGVPRNWGLSVLDGALCAEGLVSDNIVAHTQNGNAPLETSSDYPLNIENNIVYKWGEVTNTGNYPDPERTIMSYMELLGKEGSLEAFYKEIRKQRKGRWFKEYTTENINEYFRKGFGIN